MSLLANCYSAEVETHVACRSLFICLLYIYWFIHPCTVSSRPTPRAVLSDTLLILGPHSISLPCLHQGRPAGDVCCWCSYSDQRSAGLRRHHDEVCWLMLNHSRITQDFQLLTRYYLVLTYYCVRVWAYWFARTTTNKIRNNDHQMSIYATCVHRFQCHNPAVI